MTDFTDVEPTGQDEYLDIPQFFGMVFTIASNSQHYILGVL